MQFMQSAKEDDYHHGEREVADDKNTKLPTLNEKGTLSNVPVYMLMLLCTLVDLIISSENFSPSTAEEQKDSEQFAAKIYGQTNFSSRAFLSYSYIHYVITIIATAMSHFILYLLSILKSHLDHLNILIRSSPILARNRSMTMIASNENNYHHNDENEKDVYENLSTIDKQKSIQDVIDVVRI
ncbi:hypothetical protein I4U23_009035 [Adineta vaga]|nr:hypothetical protein I4U23_009035 [Adineta vaga]